MGMAALRTVSELSRYPFRWEKQGVAALYSITHQLSNTSQESPALPSFRPVAAGDLIMRDVEGLKIASGAGLPQDAR